MGASASKVLLEEAARVTRGLSPNRRKEAERGFRELCGLGASEGPPEALAECSFDLGAYLKSFPRDLPAQIGEGLFTHTFLCPAGGMVDWLAYAKAVLRFETRGATRASYEALLSLAEKGEVRTQVAEILSCFVPQGENKGEGQETREAVTRTVDLVLSGSAGALFMTDTNSGNGDGPALNYSLFTKLCRILPVVLRTMSDLSDPVPWSPSRRHGPVLNYALDRSLSLLTKERAWCLQSILDTSSHWTQIFHSDKAGKAWPTLLSRIEDHARTLILVRTAASAVIGAHGGAPWYRAAQFFGEGEGGNDCFLFSLRPNVRIYPSTGFNQYLGSNCTSGINPNGLGLGGQVKNYGLFLDQSLDVGHSYPCATFNNTQLHPSVGSEGASFGVEVVEVWCPQEECARCDEEKSAKTKKKGVLANDKFKADQMILGYAGKYQAHHKNA